LFFVFDSYGSLFLLFCLLALYLFLFRFFIWLRAFRPSRPLGAFCLRLTFVSRFLFFLVFIILLF